ncbi:MAG: phosphopantetheine-binding protein [Flavobacteriaceae bacterium]|nr:MAG: phosphopantetheine-binding protein [Flavobacteriaceae bacterium]
MKEIIVAYIENQLLSSNTEIKIGEEEDLLGSGLIDSIGMMKLLAFIEEEFHFKVSPEDMIIENFMNISAIVNYIQSKN